MKSTCRFVLFIKHLPKGLFVTFHVLQQLFKYKTWCKLYFVLKSWFLKLQDVCHVSSQNNFVIDATYSGICKGNYSVNSIITQPEKVVLLSVVLLWKHSNNFRIPCYTNVGHLLFWIPLKFFFRWCIESVDFHF